MNLLTSSGRHLLLGNEAIARGALESGIGLFSCYPGTPSSEVAEALLSVNGETPLAVEYSINEKVAMEVACGAALAGAKSMVAMKHVGLNVAADPLFTAAYIGLPGGLVVLTADDPGCHSSQNEQDNRAYARFANLPCFEPASVQEAKDMTRAAFELAKSLELPVLLRTTTRISHMRGPVEFEEPASAGKAGFEKIPLRFVPVPMVAKKRHRVLMEQLEKAAEFSENSPFNRWNAPEDSNVAYGIITSGIARAYAADALLETGLNNSVAMLELGQTWPLPEKLILSFIKQHPHILILEEGAPLLEKDIRSLAHKNNIQVEISGKENGLTEFDEYSVTLIKNAISAWMGQPLDQSKLNIAPENLPNRAPNLCPGCSHRGVYYAVRKIFGDNAVYSSDIGCYTLGLLPPLKMADFLVCMGSSISAGSGFSKTSDKTVISFIGDSTFFHSGMTGLANAVFNKHDLMVVVLDNGTTAMTGHQPNPGMRQDILGESGTHLDIEKIATALGVPYVRRVKASNLKALLNSLTEMQSQKGVRVLIAEEPCALYARRRLGRKKNLVAQILKQGEEVERCLKELACPAFKREGDKLAIDESLCSGCMFCLQIAPESIGSKRLATRP